MSSSGLHAVISGREGGSSVFTLIDGGALFSALLCLDIKGGVRKSAMTLSQKQENNKTVKKHSHCPLCVCCWQRCGGCIWRCSCWRLRAKIPALRGEGLRSMQMQKSGVKRCGLTKTEKQEKQKKTHALVWVCPAGKDAAFVSIVIGNDAAAAGGWGWIFLDKKGCRVVSEHDQKHKQENRKNRRLTVQLELVEKQDNTHIRSWSGWMKLDYWNQVFSNLSQFLIDLELLT